MGMRTVRLDDDTEEILTYVRTQTGLSVSEALKTRSEVIRGRAQEGDVGETN